MGLKFHKEMILAEEQLHPQKKDPDLKLTRLQENVTKKLGSEKTVVPFLFKFPNSSPSSVSLQMNDMDSNRPLGVIYFVKVFVIEADKSESAHKRSTINLVIKKVFFDNRFKLGHHNI